jgi:hypothetical protein
MQTNQLYTLFSLTTAFILTPLFLAYLVGIKKYNSKVEFYSAITFSWSSFLCLFLIGPWYMLTSHLRYFFLFLFIIGTIKAFYSYVKLPRLVHLNVAGWISIVINTLISLSALMIFYFALRGYQTTEQGINIDFPLTEGCIGHGGSSVIINYHHADSSAQQYAIDIVKTNALGMRTSKLLPQKLNDYNIYGDTLFSPCDAKVVVTKENLDNLPAGVMDNVNLAGNHIILAYQNSSLIIFAHLMQNSLLVSKGDFVKKGQPIARIGNSGHTSEPHLHIHAISGTDTTMILNGNGIPIYFNGNFAVRNDIIKRK